MEYLYDTYLLFVVRESCLISGYCLKYPNNVYYILLSYILFRGTQMLVPKFTTGY